jgi:GT2 family glycosyltransferase
MLAKMALDDPSVTHLLWIDSDIVAESPSDINQALRMLLQLNVPIVSGLYRAKKAKGDYPYAMWSKPSPTAEGYGSIGTWTGNFIKVDAIGFGFVLVKREVFERVPEPWFVWKTQKSEDFEFCEKVAKYGYEIKVYTDVRLSHIGTMKVRTDGAVHVLDV